MPNLQVQPLQGLGATPPDLSVQPLNAPALSYVGTLKPAQGLNQPTFDQDTAQVAPLTDETTAQMVNLLTQARQKYPGQDSQILNQFISDNEDKYPAQMGKIKSFLGTTGNTRTERNNNPTAMTTDVAQSLGLQEGTDYVQGDPFKDSQGQTLYTAKLIGSDPISATISAFDKAASEGTPIFQTGNGNPRWSYINMTNSQWEAMTPAQKQATVQQMNQKENGSSSGSNSTGFNPSDVLTSLINDNQPSTANSPVASQNSSELFRSALATGVRDIQATPELAKAVYNSAIDPAVWGLLFHNPLEFLKQGLGPTTPGSNTAQAEQTMKAPLLGANPLSAQNSEQAGGMGLEALSYLPTPMSSLLRGASFGAANAMENKGNLQQIGTQAGESALLFKGVDMAAPFLGKALGAVVPQGLQDTASAGLDKINSLLGKAGDVLNPSLDKIVPDFVSSNKNIIQQGAEKIFGKQFIQSNIDSWNEIFSGTKAAKNNLLTSLNKDKDPAGFLGSRGIMPSVDTSSGTPKWNAQPAIQKIEALASPYNDAVSALAKAKDALMSQGEMINLDDLASQAKKNIDTEINRGAGSIPAMEANIDNEIAALKQTYGETVNASQLDEIRKGQWNASTSFKRNPNPANPFKGDVHFQLGSVARNIEGKVLPEVEPLLDTLSDHYDAIKNLGKIDGNAVKNGRPYLSQLANRGIGALIGSTLGPLGAVGGDILGGLGSDMVSNFALSNPLKIAVLQSIPQDSAIYDAAQEALYKMKAGQYAAEAAQAPLALPAPAEGAARFGGGEPMQMPSQIRPLEVDSSIGRREINPRYQLPAPSGSPTGDYTQNINMPTKVIGEPDIGQTQRIGGQGSRRSINVNNLEEGQASAPAIKRGSYNNAKAAKARYLQSVINSLK